MDKKPDRSLGEKLANHPVVVIVGVIAALTSIFGVTVRFPDIRAMLARTISTPAGIVVINGQPTRDGAGLDETRAAALPPAPSTETSLTSPLLTPTSVPTPTPTIASTEPDVATVAVAVTPAQGQPGTGESQGITTLVPATLPVETPSPEPPPPSPTQPPSPTASAIPTVAPTPVPTYTPAPAPCPIAVAGELAALWDRATFGCPDAGAAIVWASWTPYERGQVVWRDDTDRVYGFFDSGWWQAVEDTWDGQSATPSRGTPPSGLFEPVRGTGWVWGTNPTFFSELGWARAEQRGFCALVQPFERGFILRSSQVESCKDDLHNNARDRGWPLGAIKAVYGSTWSLAN